MQRIFPEQLKNHLKAQLNPYYILTGQDILLLNEAKDDIIQAGYSAQFDEKVEIAVNNETQWQSLFEQLESVGLFFNRQIVIIHLPDTISAVQQKHLMNMVALAHTDVMFIIHLPKFNRNVEKQQWFNAIDNPVIVQCQTPDLSQLPKWIQNRAKSLGLALENEVVQLLSYNYEGNLLALKQILQLFQLSFSNSSITLNQAKEIVEQSSQFSPFQWIDALFEGKLARAERILIHLKNEDVQPALLLRLMQRELMILLELSRQQNQYVNIDQKLIHTNIKPIFDKLKIWQNKRELYHNVLTRLNYKRLYQLFQQLAEIERHLKQEFSEDIWQELLAFSHQYY